MKLMVESNASPHCCKSITPLIDEKSCTRLFSYIIIHYKLVFIFVSYTKMSFNTFIKIPCISIWHKGGGALYLQFRLQQLIECLQVHTLPNCFLFCLIQQVQYI